MGDGVDGGIAADHERDERHRRDEENGGIRHDAESESHVLEEPLHGTGDPDAARGLFRERDASKRQARGARRLLGRRAPFDPQPDFFFDMKCQLVVEVAILLGAQAKQPAHQSPGVAPRHVVLLQAGSSTRAMASVRRAQRARSVCT